MRLGGFVLNAGMHERWDYHHGNDSVRGLIWVGKWIGSLMRGGYGCRSYCRINFGYSSAASLDEIRDEEWMSR